MLGLYLTAELTGVTDLAPIDSPESPYYFSFKVVCTSCREEHDKWVGISRHEENDMSGSRGSANLVMRCRNCKRECSASIVDGPVAGGGGAKGTGPSTAYPRTEPPKPALMLRLDCRGCDLTAFRPDGGEWRARGLESGTPFAPIDLADGEWYDYDEKAAEEVSVTAVKWEVKRA